MSVQGWSEQDDLDAEVTADWLQEAGLAGPAYLVLQGFRPLAFLGGQGLLFLQPLLPFGTWRSAAGRFARLLSDRTQVDHLLGLLEARMGADRGAQGKEGTG